jgi:hypothetical protein
LPGCGAGCADLAYYIALNRARLPESRDRTIDRYRRSIAESGIPTDRWWDRQLDLSLLGAAVQFAWEKALGDGDDADAELAWWSERSLRARRWMS